jgi:hypothetical protein
LPGIEREGSAQLSLLETALWPLSGGPQQRGSFATSFQFVTPDGSKRATVTVHAPMGLQPFDELVLWGLLGATLNRFDGGPTLVATPFWMLKHLHLDTGGSQYGRLRESLLRIAVTSYHNTAFYNPESKEREQAAFQFLSFLLPTVGGQGGTVDNDRVWKIEWNRAFFRFCQSSGGHLLFDLDLYRELTPAARRLFLKLKDRFWRNKRVFLNVDELTVQGLGFSATRSVALRKFDLLRVLRELLDHRIIALGRGQTDVGQLIFKRGKGVYVALLNEGEYFRQSFAERTVQRHDSVLDHPLYEPLRKIGVDGQAIRRLFEHQSPSLIERWVRITDAALNESPHGFAGFRVSAAAFLIDGVQNRRTPPDWWHAHEKREQQRQYEREKALRQADEGRNEDQYRQEREAALKTFLESPEGKRLYAESYPSLLVLCQATEPHRFQEAAREATRERIERLAFRFPAFEDWQLGQEVR